MSISQNTAEDLKRLVTFYDLIANPAAYRKLLDDAKETLKTMEATISAHTTVTAAGEYLAAAKAKLAEINDSVAAHNEKIQTEYAAHKAKMQGELDDLDKRGVLAKAAAMKLQEREAAVAVREAQAAKSDEALAAKEAALVTREAKLSIGEKALAAKQAQVAAILKG